MKPLTHKARVALINIGKLLPFIVCGVVLLSYIECLYAFLSNDYVIWEDCIIPHKPISWFVSQHLEYGMLILIVLFVLSVAIETCIYNKLACIYLGINLYEKDYFAEHIYDNNIYYIAIACNIIIAAWIISKGIGNLIKTK